MRRVAAYRKLLIIAALLGAAISAFSSYGADRNIDNLITIPLALEINGKNSGDIIIRATPSLSDVEILGSSLKENLLKAVAEESMDLVHSIPEDFTTIEDIREKGFEIELNLEKLVVAISIQEKAVEITQQNTSLNFAQENKLHTGQYRDPAKVSGYTNFDISLRRQSTNANSDVLGVSMEHVLNFNSYVMEMKSSYTNAARKDQSSWKIDYVQFVKDSAKSMHRYRFGDVSTPVGNAQRGMRLGGISLAKEFSMQPYTTFIPTGTAQFELENPSTVEIYQNGILIRTTELEPGLIDVDDLRLNAGANQLKVRIIDESGNVEELDFSQFNSSSLLSVNTTQYALSLGFPRASQGEEDTFTLIDSPWLKRSYEKEPAVSGFYRRGIADAFTGEASIQATPYWQRLAVAGVYASPWGEVHGHVALNNNKNAGMGYNALLSWGSNYKKNTLRYTTSFTSPNFTQTEKTPSLDQQTAWHQSVSLSRPIGQRSRISANAYFDIKYDQQSAFGFGANFSHRFKNMRMSLNAKGRTLRSGELDSSARLMFSWIPNNHYNLVTSYFTGANGSLPEVASTMNFIARRRNSSLSASVSVNSSEDNQSYFGNAKFSNSRFSIAASHNMSHSNVFDESTNQSTTVFEGQFALSFADGAFGLSRPISDSFAIVKRHALWKDVILGVNPRMGDFEFKTMKHGINPVLVDLTSYKENSSFIQVAEGNRYLDTNDFFTRPTYKRGYKLTIGNDAVYTVVSSLIYSDLSKVKYKSIQLSQEGKDTISTFTNSGGRFVVSGMTGGTWTIKVIGSDEVASFKIEGEETMLKIPVIELYDPEYQ